MHRSRDSVVDIATGYGLDDRRVRSSYPDRVKNFSFLVIETVSGAHPTSYRMGTGGSFPVGKAARACSWPLTSS
jgi:hypothetical protein